MIQAAAVQSEGSNHSTVERALALLDRVGELTRECSDRFETGDDEGALALLSQRDQLFSELGELFGILDEDGPNGEANDAAEDAGNVVSSAVPLTRHDVERLTASAFAIGRIDSVVHEKLVARRDALRRELDDLELPPAPVGYTPAVPSGRHLDRRG